MPSQVDPYHVPPPEPLIRLTKTRKYFLAIFLALIELGLVVNGLSIAYALITQGVFVFGAALALVFAWLSVELIQFAVRIFRKRI